MRPNFLRFPYAASAVLLLVAGTATAQAGSAPLRPTLLAAADPLTALPGNESSSNADADLPSAPSATLLAADTGAVDAETRSSAGQGSVARRYQHVVLPGQTAQPLTTGQKVTYSLIDAARPVNILVWGVSSAYSQAVNSEPHYGQGWGPYGQRYGAAAARGTLQTLATDALFAPIFHDDPRYYELGMQHKPLNRGAYAVTRVFVTRSDSGQQRINFPLLVGYALAAGASNAFYPEQDRNGGQTAKTYGSSLGGAALGFLADEFLDDALRLAHLRH